MYTGRERRANGEGNYTVLPSGSIRYQASIVDERDQHVYFDANGYITTQILGEIKRTSATGPSRAAARKNFRQKCREILDAGHLKFSKQKRVAISTLTTGTFKIPNRMMAIPQNENSLAKRYLDWVLLYKRPPLVKPATFDGYIREVCRVYRFFGETDCRAVNRDRMQAYFSWLLTSGARKDQRDTGLSPKTIQNTYNLLSEFCNENLKLFPDHENPCHNTSRPNIPPSQIRVMERDEMDIFIREAFAERLYVALLLYLFTGVRLGELLALNLTDLHLHQKNNRSFVSISKNIVRVQTYSEEGKKTELICQDMPKSDDSIREIDLSEEMVVLLESWLITLRRSQKPNPKGLLFPTRNGTYVDPRHIQKRVAAVSKRCELKGIHPHTLRHTFATRLVENHVALTVVKDLLGHASVKTTERYVHTLSMEKQKAVDTLNGYIFQKLHEEQPPKNSCQYANS